ncbi:hypothetical protein CBF23_002975 [Marinomonas agarivorans]|nr:hypothetical protein CBF23_002975 [Marinomonas agarivorans]
MKIGNSSAYYGQIGLQRSQEKLDSAAYKVAQAATDVNNISQQSAQETANQEAPAHEKRYGSTVQDGLIETNSGKLEAQANAKTIEAADGNIGTIINIKA